MLKANQQVRPAASNDAEQLGALQKLFYKIGEVSSITGLEPYVLRYWETEFDFLRPRKGKSKQRMYQKKEIELLLDIKRLLYDERFTIEGVRKKLSGKFADEEALQPEKIVRDREDVRATIESIKGRLRSLLKELKKDRGVAQPG
ncbi:MAG: MerR family transcriptional regulator [Nitrospirae bacterium]|nr:MerR family transcriptional regulator [Nitrospirota bacterium]MBF0535916.1 MerR family transcriptional regulator [Nitrospirota bacterium]MBF0617752.1 MerR family transcriptional regulator [Nitrospirota bacterium]